MFDWNDYMTLADELIGKNTEAAKRSAVSRAYYAAFCVARNWLKSERGEQFEETSSVHREVAIKFENEEDKQLRAVGQHLRRLRRERNDADYKTSIPNISTNATKSLMTAKLITSSIAKAQSKKTN